MSISNSVSLLGTVSASASEDVSKLREAVTAVGNKRVSEVCGTRYAGMSLLHRDWLNLHNKRLSLVWLLMPILKMSIY